MRNIIYTCITSGKDTLDETVNTEGARAICFTNDDITSDVWEIVKIPEIFSDPRRNSRIQKTMPHMFLDCDYSLYTDGNITLKVPMQTLIDDWLEQSDIAMFEHPLRDCYFDEAKECIRLGLDDPEVIIDQCIKYKEMPRNWGLWQGGVILRKHTEQVERFNEKWFGNYCTGSRRDQISMPNALWKTNIRPDGVVGSPHNHPYFTMVMHKKPSEWFGKV